MGSLIRPSLIHRACRISQMLVVSQRYDSSRWAHHVGIVDADKPAPIISEKLTKLSEESGNVDVTVVNTSLDTIQQQAHQLLTQVTELAGSVPVEYMWVPIVTTAALFRAIYVLTTRVLTYRKMELVLPHDKWLSDMSARKWVYHQQGDMDGLAQLKKETQAYKKDNNIKYPEVNALRVFTMVKSSAIGGIIFSTLLGIRYVGEGTLSSASFYWVPSLLHPDPLYILPVVNLVVGYAVYRLDPAVRLSTNKSDSLLPSNFNIGAVTRHLKENLITMSLLIPAVSYGLFKLSTVGFDQIPALFWLYWVASNSAALCVHVLVTRSNTFRSWVGLMPHQHFSAAVSTSTSSLADTNQAINKHKREYEDESEKRKETVKSFE